MKIGFRGGCKYPAIYPVFKILLQVSRTMPQGSVFYFSVVVLNREFYGGFSIPHTLLRVFGLNGKLK